jgi:hypothetical protein
VAAGAELAATASDDDHVLHEKRRDRRALTGPHVAVDSVPHLLAGLGVDRDDVRVQRRHEDFAVSDGDAAVHVPAAKRDVEGDGVLVLPEQIARLRVNGP